MDDEMLLDLLAQAILGSTCATEKCRVSAEPHRWFVYVVHLGEHPHTCPGCDWGTSYPRHMISNELLYMSDRRLLVKHLSAWLTHLHAQSADLAQLDGGGGRGAPIDRDAPTDASNGSGVAGGRLSDSTGDRVGSGCRD